MIPIKLNISIILCCINIIKSRRRKEKVSLFARRPTKEYKLLEILQQQQWKQQQQQQQK